MNSAHRQMSWAEFHDFPWRLGYKHEYYGGKIHVVPAPAALLTMRLTLRARTPPPSCYRVRPLEAKDARGLIALYRLAFRRAPEYADWPVRIFRDRARMNVQRHVNGVEQPWFSASQLMQEKNRIVAAVFIEAAAKGPIVQPLFVRPSHQQQGLATILMQHAENRLLQLGAPQLYSHCHLANGPSVAWHRRYGFEELPDMGIAAHHYRFYAHERERRLRLGQASEQELQELQDKKDWWHREWKRLEAIGKEDLQAVQPVLQLSQDGA